MTCPTHLLLPEPPSAALGASSGQVRVAAIMGLELNEGVCSEKSVCLCLLCP